MDTIDCMIVTIIVLITQIMMTCAHRNVTNILDRMLYGYDNRQLPGMFGKHQLYLLPWVGW